MNRPVDVIEMLRQANPVPPGSVDDGPTLTVAELRASWKSLPIEPEIVAWEPGSADRPRRWPMYAAAAVLVAGVIALLLVPPDPEQPVEPVTTITIAPEPSVVSVVSVPVTTDIDGSTVPGDPIVIESPFVDSWVSTDSDGSFQAMDIAGTDTGEFALVVRDDFATVCGGIPSTMTATGQLQTADTLVFPQPVLTCDDGTTPEIDGGSLDEELANLTFVLDPASGEMVDNFDVPWQPATLDADGNPLPPEGSPAAARAIARRLIDALNSAAGDGSLDETSLTAIFTPDATIQAIDEGGERPLSEPGLLTAWIASVQTWGFDASLQSCGPEGDVLICMVRARWQTVSAEGDETWTVVVDGDRIKTLTVFSTGERYGDPQLSMSLAELDRWETWLRDNSPATAERLLATTDTTGRLPFVPRYDPALAGEIAVSIQQYIDQRPPGDEITVTADLIDVGDRLVGSVGAVARADGRTYVLAGRYQTEIDRYSSAETAVLAAFDDAGIELWRTELDRHPQHVEAVGGDLFVTRGDTTLSRIDASTGAVLDEITVDNAFGMTAAFGSLWIEVFGPTEGVTSLVRVATDLTITTIELPSLDTGDFAPSEPIEGAGVMWVPLGAGGLARVDPETMEMTVITAEEIGHDVYSVAFDGDVAYVASSTQVTSIVDGEIRATATTGEVWHLGRVDDAFGVLGPDGRFVTLTADDPMLGEIRQGSTEEQSGSIGEFNSEAWVETGDNYDLRRIQLTPRP